MRGRSPPSGPSCATFQFFMSMPFGTYRKARRIGGLAAAAKAGTMESRKGSATAAPTPFRNVLRGRDLPVMIIACHPVRRPTVSYTGTGSRRTYRKVGRARRHAPRSHTVCCSNGRSCESNPEFVAVRRVPSSETAKMA